MGGVGQGRGVQIIQRLQFLVSAANGGMKSAAPLTIRSYDALGAALDHVCAEDPALTRLRAALGARRVALRRAPPGYATLLKLIVYQQISLQAAGAIWARLSAQSVTPQSMRAAGVTGLAALGLSSPKARYAVNIAAAVLEGSFAFEALARLSDDGARAALMALPGIGAWTAELYLLSALLRADAFPAGDLALQEAARSAFSLSARPNASELTALGERWRPYRSAAARLLWTHYRAEKARLANTGRAPKSGS
jgi:DNA-3-methyladenine glycosylase II